MTLAIGAFEFLTAMPAGGNFRNNAASEAAAGYGIFSGNPGLKTSEDLYLGAQGDAQGPPPRVSMAPIPPTSNFSAVPFPIRFYDPNLDYGNPTQAIMPGGLRGP
jgi:hypothetical protein